MDILIWASWASWGPNPISLPNKRDFKASSDKLYLKVKNSERTYVRNELDGNLKCKEMYKHTIPLSISLPLPHLVSGTMQQTLDDRGSQTLTCKVTTYYWDFSGVTVLSFHIIQLKAFLFLKLPSYKENLHSICATLIVKMQFFLCQYP